MKIVCYTEPTEKGLLLHYPSLSVKQKMLETYNLAKEKSSGYMTVDIARVYKSRTTGEGSQNNKFYALVTEICKETGNDLEDIKDCLKERALKRGYPYSVNKLTGSIKPFSTTKINTVEMSYLIEEAIQLCAELGIVVDLDTEVKGEEDTTEYDIF